MYISFKEIIAEQKQPLDHKIQVAIDAIKAGYDVCRSKAAIAFSGGKDSTVLWHLIKTHFPEQHANTAVIFGNTGVEYPESLKFSRELGELWGGVNFYEARPGRLEKAELKYEAQKQVLEYLVENGLLDQILKADGKLKTTQTLEKACPPEMWKRFETEKLVWKAGTIKSYWWCADQYGFPIMGKAASKLKARRINIDCFLRFSSTTSEKEELAQYYAVLQKAKISQACCDILKKEPSEKLETELKVDVIFKGLMAAESQMRRLNFSTRGFLFKSSRKYLDTPFYHCNPLQTWTDDDIWEYIYRYDVPYSELYDTAYIDQSGKPCKMKRNGCMGCFTDFGRKNNHMFALRQTHYNQWKGIMRYGMGRELQKLRTFQKSDKEQFAILHGMNACETEEAYEKMLQHAIENRPCAFD